MREAFYVVMVWVGDVAFVCRFPRALHPSAWDFAQGVAKFRPRGFSPGGALGECLPDLQVDGRTETGKSAH